MIYKLSFIMLAVFGMFFMEEAYAQNSADHTSHNIIPVRLKVGALTEAEFPENIANVTKSISSESLQIETLGKRMFLLAREMLDSHIYVVTQDNISYSLHLVIDEAGAMAHIDITKPASSQKEEEKNNEAVNTIKLLKALIGGEGFRNVARSNLCKQEIFNDGVIRIVMDEMYEFGSGVKAISLTLENLTNKPIVVPVEHIELPGLLAISVESQILEARSGHLREKNLSFKTKAYMIMKGIK